MNADFPLLIKTLLTAPLQAVPDQQIISDGLGHFTYRDFSERLHRLAGALSNAGVGQGTVVGVIDSGSSGGSAKSSTTTTSTRRRRRGVYHAHLR